MYSRWEAIRDAGVKFVSINPQRTTTDEAMRAEWVKIIPNTDTALLLALAHVLITEGRNDTGFLDRCTSGFETFRDYVLGTGDGTLELLEVQAPGRKRMAAIDWARQGVTGRVLS